jgi:hypothetical protein
MNIIKKIIAPTKQHHEEFNTLWIADLDQGIQMWLQTSQDIEKPNWERVGNLYEQWALEVGEKGLGLKWVVPYPKFQILEL